MIDLQSKFNWRKIWFTRGVCVIFQMSIKITLFLMQFIITWDDIPRRTPPSFNKTTLVLGFHCFQLVFNSKQYFLLNPQCFKLTYSLITQSALFTVLAAFAHFLLKVALKSETKLYLTQYKFWTFSSLLPNLIDFFFSKQRFKMLSLGLSLAIERKILFINELKQTLLTVTGLS